MFQVAHIEYFNGYELVYDNIVVALMGVKFRLSKKKVTRCLVPLEDSC